MFKKGTTIFLFLALFVSASLADDSKKTSAVTNSSRTEKAAAKNPPKAEKAFADHEVDVKRHTKKSKSGSPPGVLTSK